MKRLLKISIALILFCAFSSTSPAQVVSLQDKTGDVALNKSEAATGQKAEKIKEQDKAKSGKSETKPAPVKQVKSARPDMSRSRGARPPDIVRPSGSRIPRGVGRPAGAMRRGRG